MMEPYTITEYDVLTGVEVHREMTAEEIAGHEAYLATLPDSDSVE
jgi:hypothetical protein